MKVKIEDKIYDSTKIPILLIFNKDEIKHMQDMEDNNHKYCSFPDDAKEEDIDEFMNVDEEELIGYMQY